MIAQHLVARAYPGLRPLLDSQVCAALWLRLMREFPRCWGAVFMPNHLHFLVPKQDCKNAVFRMGVCLRASSQALGRGDTWAVSPPATDIPDAQQLLRNIRYVHLNPCRAGLVHDPLLWQWSTHRDLVGASYPMHLDLVGLSATLEMRVLKLIPFLKKYISQDPSVSSNATAVLEEKSFRSVSALQLKNAIERTIRPHADWPKSRKLALFMNLYQQTGGQTHISGLSREMGVPPQTLFSARKRGILIDEGLKQAIQRNL